MKIELTPRQVEVLRGAVVLRIETILEQAIEPLVSDDGTMGEIPNWGRAHNAEIYREVAMLDRILAKLSRRVL